MIAIIACSNGLRKCDSAILENVSHSLSRIDIPYIISEYVFQNNEGLLFQAEEKAKELNSLLINDTIDALFDISGGDSANLMLPFVDFNLFKKTRKTYFGISDNSVMLNAIVELSETPAYHYFIRNLIENEDYFLSEVLSNNRNKVNFPYWF